MYYEKEDPEEEEGEGKKEDEGPVFLPDDPEHMIVKPEFLPDDPEME